MKSILRKTALCTKALFLPIFLCVCLTGLQTTAQTIKKATQGSGTYKDKIWWLDFTGVELAAGSTVNQTYTLYGGLITLVVTIDNITFSGTLASATPLSSQRLIGYNSGKYGGDGLVMLYNIGVPNAGATPADRQQNTLFNALSMKFDGNYSGSPNEAKANFRVRAHAYVTATGALLDAGLVFADAETDEPDPAWPYEEYSQGTTNGTPWQILERSLQDPGGYQNVVVSNAGLTAKTICGFNGFVFAPGNVAVMYTNKPASSTTNRLAVDIEFKGGGNSATAIGLFIAGVDKGDAPASFSLPNHIALTSVSGGSLANGSYYISSQSAGTPFGGSPLLPANGQLSFVTNPILGTTIDFDDYTTITMANAVQDNTNGINDEDGISSFPVIPGKSSIPSYTVNVNVVNTGAVAATLSGWIDWNTNGVFNTGEHVGITIPAGYSGIVPLQWTGITLSGAGGTPGTYARFRISTDPAIATSPTATAANGEVEDYWIPFQFPLSAVFSDVNATWRDNQLRVNWTTTKETDNSHFEVEVSEDGNIFTTIGTVKSSAVNGNSSVAINYEFITNQSTLLFGSAIAILLIGSLGIRTNRRRKYLIYSIATVAMAIGIISCSKGSQEVTDAKESLFIRIAQVDKSGIKSYSKVVKLNSQQ